MRFYFDEEFLSRNPEVNAIQKEVSKISSLVNALHFFLMLSSERGKQAAKDSAIAFEVAERLDKHDEKLTSLDFRLKKIERSVSELSTALKTLETKQNFTHYRL